jgi:hypothetical protein
MQLARPAIAVDPRRFGRGQARELEPVRIPSSSFGSDLKLFATTFICGFVFVSVLIA